MSDVEMILGEFEFDNPEGRWFPAKHKSSFVRFYSTGFRELIHKRDEGWTVSIACGDYFEVGTRHFETTREAKWFADNRDMDALWQLEMFADNIRRKMRNDDKRCNDVKIE